METGFVQLVREKISPLLIVFSLSLFVPIPTLAHEEDHEGLTWPPDPRGITNVIIHSDVAQENSVRALAIDGMDRLEQKAKSDPRANRALGKKFTRVTRIDKEDKKSGKVVSQIVFFSYDKNATVVVEFADEKTQHEKIQTVKSTPAREYQPEITPDEASQAAELARTHFLNLGVTKVADLKAYSILAYKPKGVGFYNTRVIYVSFHKDDDSPPEFVAWVDLSNQRILKSREER